jgi:hypothetical protein
MMRRMVPSDMCVASKQNAPPRLLLEWNADRRAELFQSQFTTSQWNNRSKKHIRLRPRESVTCDA